MKLKKIRIHIIVIILAIIVGMLLQHSLFAPSTTSNSSVSETKKPLYWVDSMEPTIHYPGPGKSRMGMELTPVYPEENNSAEQGTVMISSATVDNLGVRISPVLQGDLPKIIETVAYVQPDENSISHIHTYVQGWLRNLAVKTVGEPVQKNQLLFQLYSPLLTNAQEEYLITLQSDDADLMHAAQRKLIALGISDRQIQRLKETRQSSLLVDVLSPQNGFVTELNVRQGMEVTPEVTIMSIADLSSVWLMAQVFEEQTDWVKTGASVEARFSAFPGKVWKGVVEYIYPEVDPTTRTLKVRFRFANPNNTIKPNMYANLTFLAESKHNVLNIPLEALIRSGEGDHVIVALGKGRFQVRSVSAGMESGDRVEILSGLNFDEKVVTSSQFLIDSEANLKATFQRLETPNTTATPKDSSKVLPKTFVGMGVLKTIDIFKRSLTIEHQPIPALNWPAMTMDFSVTKAIDLKPFKIGEHIQFNLEQMPNGEYVINHIQLMSDKPMEKR